MSNTKHIGHQVIAMMDRMGVSPITRNYHLFYICIANSDPVIRKAVRNLGRYPTQDQLDQIIEEHCPEAVDSLVMLRHEKVVIKAIDDLAARLHSEESQMTGFNKAVENVSAALAKSVEQDRLTADLLRKVVDAIGQASTRRTAAGKRTLQRMGKSLSDVDALREELVKVRRMANTDALTGLSNRRHFDERLAAAVGRSSEFALVLVDIDHFKSINDTHGHAFGDHVLKAVAAALAKATRAGTFIARVGGEEFAVVLTQAGSDQAMGVAERLRETVEGMSVSKAGEIVPITVSAGVAISEPNDNAGRIYEAADAALYRSKAAGRNQVTLHETSGEIGTGGRYRIYGT